MIKTIPFGTFLFLILLLSTACSTSEPPIIPTAIIVSQSNQQETDGAYPAPQTETNSGYPAPDYLPSGIVSEPPNPELNLPASESETANVGGVLVEDFVGEGYVPLMPVKLQLGLLLETDQGNPAYIKVAERGGEAELFPTGIFIFRNIAPGTYGMAIDLGYAQFLVEQDGEPVIFTVEAGDTLDLGQIFIILPGR